MPQISMPKCVFNFAGLPLYVGRTFAGDTDRARVDVRRPISELWFLSLLLLVRSWELFWAATMLMTRGVKLWRRAVRTTSALQISGCSSGSLAAVRVLREESRLCEAGGRGGVSWTGV